MQIKVIPTKDGGERVEVRFSYAGHDRAFSMTVEEFKQMLIHRKGTGSENIGPSGPIAFDKFLVQYEQLYGRKLKSWEISERFRCGQLLKHFASTPIHRMTTEVILRFRATIDERGNSGADTNRLVARLSAVLGKAVKLKYLKTNPASDIEKLPENNRNRALNWREFETLRAHCDEWMNHLATTAVNTGMRKSELLELRWPHVDLDARRIVVLNTKNELVRYMPMNAVVYEVFRSIPKHVGCDHVFQRNGRKVKDFQHRWRKAVQAAGLGDLHFHDLRHTFTTWLSERGYNPVVVMALTGHKTLAMLTRYSNISDPTVTEAVEAIASAPPLRLNSDNGKGSKNDADR